MKNYSKIAALLIIASIGLVSFNNPVEPGKKSHAIQKQYLPDDFKKLYFGMPLKKFKKVTKNKVSKEPGLMSFRIEFVETKPKNPSIKEVTYYFDVEGKMPLYELIIEYNSEKQRDNVAGPLLGKPNYGDEWVFDSGEGFDIRAWTFKSKLIIIGVLPGSEWEGEYE